VLLLNSLIALARRWREQLDDPQAELASARTAALAAAAATQGARP
jgi:hypothetical protein